jgi:ribonuclease-3
LNSEFYKLEKTIGHRFGKPELLADALTHRSASNRNNERLEFLGDSILNFVIADELFQRCPQESEGALSRLRASLVNRPSLAVLGRELQLGDYLRLGSGELKSGGHRRDSILADCVEAIFGAVYLDAGFQASRGLITRLYAERLENLPIAAELKDPKTRLQEHLQGLRRPLPQYQVLEVSGKAHNQRFRVQCEVEGVPAPSEGVANSRRQAEQQAAEAMLAMLNDG